MDDNDGKMLKRFSGINIRNRCTDRCQTCSDKQQAWSVWSFVVCKCTQTCRTNTSNHREKRFRARAKLFCVSITAVTFNVAEKLSGKFSFVQ